MKNARYYIELITGPKHTREEWVAIQKEVGEWFAGASEEEQHEFTYSGAGELLSMMCTALS